MDFDQVLVSIGGFGKYQKLVLWMILVPMTFPCGFHAYNQLFMTLTPDHWCYAPELKGLDVNVTKKLSIPPAENGAYSKCHMFKRNYTARGTSNSSSQEFQEFEIEPCGSGWTFDASQNWSTIVTEWNLVCDKSYKPTVALVLFGVGGLIGSYIFGYLQDGIGRKPSFYLYLAGQCLLGSATAFVHNFKQWISLRFLIGFTIPAILGTPIVLAIELVSPEHRTFVTLIVNVGYAFGLCLLATVAYFIRDWRQLCLATSLPFILWFCVWRLCPESPRWLLARGKFKELKNLVQKIARINGKEIPATLLDNFSKTLQEEDTNQEKFYGIYDLFRGKNLRYKTILIIFVWFTNLSVYVGLSYYSTALGGDEYLNFFLTGAVELPAYIILWITLEKCGRRWNLCCTMFLSGIACVSTYFFTHNKLAILILYCIAKIGISCAFVVTPLVASEIYPTVVRGLGMNFSNVIGMIGSIIIPIVNYLGNDFLTLPLVIMGIMCSLGGLACLMLPETLNKPLPETLEDGEVEGLQLKPWKTQIKNKPTNNDNSAL